MRNSEVNYFEEKAAQISVGGMTAFGITISTRYDRAGEMAEMLQFTKKAARAGLHHFVEEIFYDSKADLCTFKFVDGFDQNGEDAQKFKRIAAETIGQYYIFGDIGHGNV
ncbi:hypothetical protein [Klebsiella pneumoniae]|uniref:hypothetical protein n=1 Tax=Klebsiella pneumoniae TaxID=573 RepID=UPI001E47A5DA|nr:hypothetical protein [Klebsiella pneumoniae]MCC7732758.1 hypothetical protein [Klebsiella pneumoniae]